MEILVLTKSTAPIIGWVAELLGLIMEAIFNVTALIGVRNIGWSIIIFTIIINLIMLPLTIKQQRTSKLMSVIQPEIQAIQKKYKDKKDNESLMKMQAETRAVYDKYGTSMTGGCLPLVIQMPILFALYAVIRNIPAYVSSVKTIFASIATALMAQDAWVSKVSEITTAQTAALISDNSTIEKVIDFLYTLTPEKWTYLSEKFPAMADVLNTNVPLINEMNYFFGINLAAAPWQGMIPTIAWIIPILSGLTQWYSAKLMTANQPSSSGDDNMMAQQMKTMNTVMPLMSVWFCFTLPAGLGLYWIASALCRIVQQVLINRHLEQIDIDKLVEENLAKANKKRAKQGLPAQTVNKNILENAKHAAEIEEKNKEQLKEKLATNAKHIEDSSKYYNENAKPGSLAAKANMVAKYNEKQNNKKK